MPTTNDDGMAARNTRIKRNGTALEKHRMRARLEVLKTLEESDIMQGDKISAKDASRRIDNLGYINFGQDSFKNSSMNNNVNNNMNKNSNNNVNNNVNSNVNNNSSRNSPSPRNARLVEASSNGALKMRKLKF